MAGQSLLSLPTRGGAGPPAAATGRDFARSQQREKGLWNFLTWAFFLSQVVAAEQALGASAKTGDLASEEGLAQPIDGGSSTEAASLASASAAGRAGAEEAGSVAGPVSGQDVVVQFALANPTAGPPGFAKIGGGRDADAADFAFGAIVPSFDAAGAPSSSGGVPAGVALQAPASSIEIGLPLGPISGDPLTGIISPLSDILDVLGSTIPPVLGQVLPVLGAVGAVTDTVVGQVVSPLLGAVSAVADTVVGQVVAPVLGAVDAVADTVVGQVVSPVLGAVGTVTDTVVGQVVAPVLGAVDAVADTVVGQVVSPVLGAVGTVTDTVLGQVVAPVLGAVGAVTDTVVGQVVAPVLGAVGAVTDTVVGQVVAPVLGAVDAVADIVVGQVVAPVTGIVGALGRAGDVAPSSGSVSLQAGAAVGGGVLDDLFVGNRYTDYNLALQTGAPPSGVTLEAAVSASADIGFDHILDSGAADHGSAHGQGSSHNVGLPSILDDIVHRSLGDGIV